MGRGREACLLRGWTRRRILKRLIEGGELLQAFKRMRAFKRIVFN